MKRILLLLCLAALVLTGCGSRETEFSVEKRGVTYTVNTEAGTISGGGYNCRYSLPEDKDLPGRNGKMGAPRPSAVPGPTTLPL